MLYHFCMIWTGSQFGLASNSRSPYLAIMLFMASPQSVCLGLCRPTSLASQFSLTKPDFSLSHVLSRSSVIAHSPPLVPAREMPCLCLSLQRERSVLSSLDLKPMSLGNTVIGLPWLTSPPSLCAASCSWQYSLFTHYNLIVIVMLFFVIRHQYLLLLVSCKAHWARLLWENAPHTASVTFSPKLYSPQRQVPVKERMNELINEWH